MARKRGETKSRQQSAAPAPAPTVRPADPDNPQAIIRDAVRTIELMEVRPDGDEFDRLVAGLPGRLQRLDAELKVLRAGTVWPIIPDRPAHGDELLAPTPKSALMRAADDMDLAVYTLRQAAEALSGLELEAGDVPKLEFWCKALAQRADELEEAGTCLSSWFCTSIREARD